MNNKYFPCLLVEHKDYSSIILSSFHYFDDYKGPEIGGGYGLDKLAKKLIKEHKLTKGIKFDSEAGMFCAYSPDLELLEKLCKLFREITGEESQYEVAENKPLISLAEAEKLLIEGFVIKEDKAIQKDFLSKVPLPALSKKQAAYVKAIEEGTDEEMIFAAKKINSEARTLTRNWDHYLSHPEIISLFLKAIDSTENPKVYQELLWALVFICDRHLPDLRTKPYYLKALKSKQATIRWLGLMGLEDLYEFPKEEIIPLKEDRSKKVRDRALTLLNAPIKRGFPSWMFEDFSY